MRVTYTAPPTSFDPGQASPAELADYGLTPPAQGTPRRALWDKEIGQMQFAPPPERQIVYPNKTIDGALPVARPGTSAESVTFLNWSGRYNDADYQQYDTAEGLYIEPSVEPVCEDGEEVEWTGLGGVNSKSLEQNGTANDVGSLGNHQAWWEILPAGIAPIEFFATADGLFEVRTHWASAELAEFVFINWETDYEVRVPTVQHRLHG